MKIFRNVILFFVVVFAAFFGVSSYVGRKWGAEIDKLEIQSAAAKFKAARNEVGIWRVDAATPESLWFAFGYLHMQDRAFQMELMRTVATGRLASWFGASQLLRDRLNRMSAHLAREEWDKLVATDPLKQGIEAYLAGRREFLKRNPDKQPVEFRIFSLKPEDIPEWEPWEVLAISRLHTWEFSYDIFEQIRTVGMKQFLSDDLTRLLMPKEPADSAEVMYNEPLLRGLQKRLGPKSTKVSWPAMYAPAANNLASDDSHDAVSAPASADVALLPTPPGLESMLGAELGASNIWILANPRTALEPTLCNDTHLGFTWPGPLYPIEFKMGEIDAQGFMLPGTPGIVVGRVDRPEKSFAWGVTIANYADTQTLISLSPTSLAKARRAKEVFKVRDPRSFAVSEQSFTETWTPHGPRVDEILDWKGARVPGPLALDWIGFRRVASPMRFYMNRNFGAQDGLREDLAGLWTYPSVNFTWIERDQTHGTRLGHAVTGLIFDRDRPDLREILSEKQAETRRLSAASERPFVDFAYDGREAFFMANGNQSVFPKPLASRLAFEWGDRVRVKRILRSYDEAILKPEFAQTDYLSLTLLDFVKAARERISADRLCAQGDPQYLHSCFEVISALDKWDGLTLESKWEPTLAALWYAKAKESLWPIEAIKNKPERAALFADWHHSNGSIRALSNMMNSPELRARWESLTKRSFNDALLDAFRESLELLVEGLGPLTSSWAWGNVHYIDWAHPVKFIPEPLGPLLQKSLFGPPIGVSGALDTPGRFDFSWNPKAPLDFPSRHGAAMRMCATVGSTGPARIRWTASTGVSGNPLSKWAWPFARDYYFKNKLYEGAAR